ncbi:hypothetical protein GCM10023221_02260 [Luteimicrobium xylanilyticum]|uniref:Uncharacterized protein n=1 Tax=Luteimicrobium xylanilyticum TaxID=1133546 RepID=A0A5P9Q7R4_9MICO|nr:hypothetical protein [Luteimicrobium xylanilyticum]QFU97478.1 hypothetical protein KDY119_00976 [Luteimicrobium xylanilyticum]
MTTHAPDAQAAGRRIDALLEEVDQTPFGPHERALLDQALALAVEGEDEVREYRARMRLTASANMTGDTDTVLSSFAWCVGMHDRDPERFPTSGPEIGGDLLWHYKWMSGALSLNPVFPAEQIHAVLDDMAQRYDRAGVGRSGVVMARFGAAAANGWADEAEAAYAELQVTPDDEYSHCDACVRSETADWLAAVGREDEALRLYDEMVAEGYACGEEPERALSQALVPMLRAGRFDDARAAHLRSYRDARGNAGNLGIVARHLAFCAVTGNEARGLSMLERHLPWFGHDGLNALEHFEALASAALLLDAVTAAGHGDAPVRGSDGPELAPFVGEHEGRWTAAELAPRAWDAAARVAGAFDARNGNAHFAGRLAGFRALADERYDVPVETDAPTPAPVAVPDPDPVDARGWGVRARERAIVGDVVGALAAVDRGLASADDRTRAALLGTQLGILVGADRHDDARLVLADRIASLRASGQAYQADLEERLGLVLFGTAVPDDAARLEAEAQAAQEAGEPAAAADASLTLAVLLGRSAEDGGDAAVLGPQVVAAARRAAVVAPRGAERVDELWEGATFVLALSLAQTTPAEPDAPGRPGVEAPSGPEQALAALDELVASLHAAPGSNRARLADAHRLRARLRAGAGDFDRAVADASATLELDLALGARERATDAAMLGAAILGDLGRPHEAVARLRLAVRQAELAESPRVVGARYALGRQLADVGASVEAVEVLQTVLEQEEADGARPAARAETLEALGHASRDADEPGAAASAWSRAVDLFEEDGAGVGAARVRLANGTLHFQAGYARDAVELLEPAVVQAREAEQLGLLVDVLHLLGRARCADGDPAGLRDLDEVLDLARRHDASWLVADVTDSRARSLVVLDRLDEAVAAALAASDLYAAAGDTRSGGGSLLFAGRALLEATREDEAAAVYRSAADQFAAAGEADGEAVTRLELADVLDRLGRGAEAAVERAAAERAAGPVVP